MDPPTDVVIGHVPIDGVYPPATPSGRHGPGGKYARIQAPRHPRHRAWGPSAFRAEGAPRWLRRVDQRRVSTVRLVFWDLNDVTKKNSGGF